MCPAQILTHSKSSINVLLSLLHCHNWHNTFLASEALFDLLSIYTRTRMFQLGLFLQLDPEQNNESVPSPLTSQVPIANQDGWF